MKKEQKLRHVDELLKVASGWKSFNRDVLVNFIEEAQLKIGKIKGHNSKYIKEIDVLSNGKNRGFLITDWKEQILSVLNRLKFEIETEDDSDQMNKKTISLFCNKCNNSTKHSILFQKTERETSLERVGINVIDFWTDKTVQLLMCSCGEYSLRKFDIWCDDAPDFPEINIEIIPKRGRVSIKPAEAFQNIPLNIISLYKEIVETFINESNLLCAGGVRAILEAICNDKEIKGGITDGKFEKFLRGKIYGLFEHGFITQKHSEILLHHKYIGDKALHELQIPTSEELQIAIEIIGHTLHTVYELEVKGRELKERKEERIKAIKSNDFH